MWNVWALFVLKLLVKGTRLKKLGTDYHFCTATDLFMILAGVIALCQVFFHLVYVDFFHHFVCVFGSSQGPDDDIFQHIFVQ